MTVFHHFALQSTVSTNAFNLFIQHFVNSVTDTHLLAIVSCYNVAWSEQMSSLLTNMSKLFQEINME